MLCETCGKSLRAGAVFCGKCGAKIPIKCLTCGTVREEEDDLFCVQCGSQLPESPTAGAAPPPPKPAARVSRHAAPPPPSKPVEIVKTIEKAPEIVLEKPAPKPKAVETVDGWRITAGKDLMEFYDLFSYKVGFVIEEEEPIDGTNFTLRAHGSKIIIWDEKQNGIKLEGFFKDGKRVSFWVNIQKNGSNDVQHQVGGKDEVVLGELESIHTFMEYYNPKLITAIERCRAKYCQ